MGKPIRPPSKTHIVRAKADLVLAACVAFADNPNDDTGAELDRCAMDYRDALAAHEAAKGAAHSEKVG